MVCEFQPGDTLLIDGLLNCADGRVLKIDSAHDACMHLGIYEIPSWDLQRHAFVFIAEHKPQEYHCVVLGMNTKKLYIMCDVNWFRKATEDEC